MAISYITGIPGSGKSYLATYRLWESFIKVPKSKKDKKAIDKNFTFAYTNINQFKFEISKKIKPLDFENLTAELTNLYAVYKSVDGKDDSLLIQEAKKCNLYEVFIVVDEAHNFLTDKEDEVIKWWLTYHRHLGHEIWFITQDLSLIATGYKTVAEFFYKAIPSSRRLFKNRLKFSQYSSYKMYQKDYISNFKIPALQEVFNLYHSGFDGNSKSLIHKFIKIAILLFLMIIIGINFFLSQFSSVKDKKPVEHTSESLNFTELTEIKEVKKLIDSEIYPYEVICILENCKITGNYEKMPFSYFTNYISENNPNFIDTEILGDGIYKFFLIYGESKFINFIKEYPNEKNSHDYSSPSLFGSS